MYCAVVMQLVVYSQRHRLCPERKLMKASYEWCTFGSLRIKYFVNFTVDVTELFDSFPNLHITLHNMMQHIITTITVIQFTLIIT